LGGILSGATGDLPVVMSEATAQVLLGLNLLTNEYLRQCAIILPFGQPLIAGEVIITLFPVPHCPGSTGFEIDDGKNLLLYPGDLVLRTSRHYYLSELINRLKRLETRRCSVLLDATMAGRSHGASSSTTASDVFKQVSGYKDVVVISRDVEQLVYAYLDLFNRAKSTGTSRHQVAFLLSPRMRSAFQVLHSAFIDHSSETLDPILSAQYGKSLSSWAESRWLFWIDSMTSIPEDKLRFWFVSDDEVSDVKPIGRVGILLVGRLENFSNWHWTEETLVLPVDTSPWTLHSDETSLTEGIIRLLEYAEVILFHNFTSRLKKYLKNQGLKASVVGDAPIFLGA
jgi:hypothetical protein